MYMEAKHTQNEALDLIQYPLNIVFNFFPKGLLLLICFHMSALRQKWKLSNDVSNNVNIIVCLKHLVQEMLGMMRAGI